MFLPCWPIKRAEVSPFTCEQRFESLCGFRCALLSLWRSNQGHAGWWTLRHQSSIMKTVMRNSLRAIHHGLECEQTNYPSLSEATERGWAAVTAEQPVVDSLSPAWLCDPGDCSPPGSSVHGISQARILEWGAVFPPRDLPNPGIEPEFNL